MTHLDFRLPQIYEEFYHTINNADHEKDLRLWSNTHGVNMAMNWPQFEVRAVSQVFCMISEISPKSLLFLFPFFKPGGGKSSSI